MKTPKSVKHSEQLKTIILLMMLASVVLIVVAISGSFWVHDIVSEKAIQDYDKTLASAMEHIEADIEGYRTLADQYSNLNWVKKIVYMQGSDIDNSRMNTMDIESFRELIRLQSCFSNAYEICLAFFDKDLAMGSSTRCDLNYLANNYLHIEGMSKSDWIDFGAAASLGTIAVMPDVTIDRFGTNVDSILLAFPVNPASTKNAAALFIAISHRDFLESYFSDILNQGTDIQLAVSKTGDDSSFLIAGSMPSDQVITVAAESKDLKIRVELNMPGKVILDEVIAVRNRLLLLVLGLLIASGVLSIFISNRLLRPIRKLLNMINSEEVFQQECSEYEALENGINQLIKRENVMRQELSMRRILLRNAQIERLLNGVKLQPEDLVHMSPFDSYALYCICLLMWKDSSAQMPLPEQIEETINQTRRNEKAYESIVLRRAAQCILVVGYTRHEELENAIVSLLDRWENLYVAIGTEEDSLMKLNDSYLSAKRAKDYRCVAEGYRVLRQDNISQNISYYFPQEQENTLIRFISCGQEDKAKALFNRLYEANMTDNSTTEKGIQNFLFNINFTMVKLLPAEADMNLLENVNQEESIDVLRAITEDNIESVSKYCRQKWMGKSTRMENLLNYVDANLTDTELSLDKVADYFGISPSLVSRLFAEQHGERFHDYVNKQRVQKSLEYLMSPESKMDISQIASQVGYMSDATFRRLFKKYMGIAPSEYRANMWKA